MVGIVFVLVDVKNQKVARLIILIKYCFKIMNININTNYKYGKKESPALPGGWWID